MMKVMGDNVLLVWQATLLRLLRRLHAQLLLYLAKELLHVLTTHLSRQRLTLLQHIQRTLSVWQLLVHERRVLLPLLRLLVLPHRLC